MSSAYTKDAYLQNPCGFDLNFDIESERLISLLLKTASHSMDFAPFRWRCLKKIRDVLVSEGKIRHFEIKLTSSLQPVAYMHDDGVIYISSGLLFRGSALATLGIFIHELCHIRLSQREDYPEIKALQKEFRANFRSHKQCELMSPIEIFANILTLKLLRKIEDEAENKLLKKRIAKVRDVKERAFSHLIKQIKNLNA